MTGVGYGKNNKIELNRINCIESQDFILVPKLPEKTFSFLLKHQCSSEVSRLYYLSVAVKTKHRDKGNL